MLDGPFNYAQWKTSNGSCAPEKGHAPRNFYIVWEGEGSTDGMELCFEECRKDRNVRGCEYHWRFGCIAFTDAVVGVIEVGICAGSIFES